MRQKKLMLESAYIILYCTLWLCTSAVTSRKYTTNQFPFWAWPSLSLSQWQRTLKAPTSRLLPGFQTWAKHGFHVDSSHIFFSFNPSEGIPFRNCYISNISSLVCNMCKHPGSCRVPDAPLHRFAPVANVARFKLRETTLGWDPSRIPRVDLELDLSVPCRLCHCRFVGDLWLTRTYLRIQQIG